MSAPFFEFPTHEDWSRIYKTSPFDEIFSLIDKLDDRFRRSHDGIDFMKIAGVIGHINDLYQRLSYAGKGYILMMFYYEKGIPDDKWYESSPQSGTTYWFPDFKQQHWHIKGWFNFYSDTFYYKLFSSWDTIGHILNKQYYLNQRKVDFLKAVQGLEKVQRDLYTELNNLVESEAYKTAQRIRNDLTHNYLPNIPGMAVFEAKPNPIGVTHSWGIKSYITSKQIVTNISDLLGLFANTIEHIIGYIK